MRRPNKLAEGVTKTLERQRKAGTFRGYKSSTTPMLAVRGTLDKLASSIPTIGKAKCPCCGGTGRGKRELTEKGKRRLAQLRKLRENKD